MLIQMQKDMLANAFARDKQLVLQIYVVAMQHRDEDTIRYIAEHYAVHFDSTVQQLMQEDIAMLDAEQTTVH